MKTLFIRIVLLLFLCISLFEAQEQDSLEVDLDSLLNQQINPQNSPMLRQVSSATKYRQIAGEAPSSVTIVTSDDIERYGSQTLADVLTRIRGFYLSDDRNYMYLGVRGFGRPTDYNNRILVLINNHPLNENVYGSVSVGYDLGIDLSNVKRIEIIRGPSSSLYGTNAMFAVINVITKSGNEIDGTQLSGVIGSYGRREASILYGQELDDGLDFSISGKWSDTKGQDLFYEEYNTDSTNFGVAQNLDWEKYYNISGRLSYKNFSFNGLLTERQKGIPTGAYGIDFNNPDAKTFDAFGFLNLHYEYEISADKKISLSSSINNYRYRGTSPASTYGYDESEGTWLDGEVQFRWDIRSNNRILLGTEYRNSFEADYVLWTPDTVFFNNDFPFQQYSLYFQNEYQFPFHLALTLGVRRDEYSNFGSATTPRIGLIYSPSQLNSYKLLYSEAFRAPNIYEVNFEDPVSGYKRNSSIQPERIHSLEAVWEHQFTSEITSTVSLYNLNMSNLIDQNIDTSDQLIYYDNTGRVQGTGVEFEIDVTTVSDIHAYTNYSLQYAEDSNADTKLSNSPSHLLKFGISVPLAEHLYASLDSYYESERLTIQRNSSSEYFLTNFTLALLPLTKDPTPYSELMDHFDVYITIKNLFNTSYATPGGFEHVQPLIPQNGRNYLLKVTFGF